MAKARSKPTVAQENFFRARLGVTTERHRLSQEVAERLWQHDWTLVTSWKGATHCRAFLEAVALMVLDDQTPPEVDEWVRSHADHKALTAVMLYEAQLSDVTRAKVVDRYIEEYDPERTQQVRQMFTSLRRGAQYTWQEIVEACEAKNMADFPPDNRVDLTDACTRLLPAASDPVASAVRYMDLPRFCEYSNLVADVLQMSILQHPDTSEHIDSSHQSLFDSVRKRIELFLDAIVTASSEYKYDYRNRLFNCVLVAAACYIGDSAKKNGTTPQDCERTLAMVKGRTILAVDRREEPEEYNNALLSLLVYLDVETCIEVIRMCRFAKPDERLRLANSISHLPEEDQALCAFVHAVVNSETRELNSHPLQLSPRGIILHCLMNKHKTVCWSAFVKLYKAFQTCGAGLSYDVLIFFADIVDSSNYDEFCNIANDIACRNSNANPTGFMRRLSDCEVSPAKLMKSLRDWFICANYELKPEDVAYVLLDPPKDKQESKDGLVWRNDQWRQTVLGHGEPYYVLRSACCFLTHAGTDHPLTAELAALCAHKDDFAQALLAIAWQHDYFHGQSVARTIATLPNLVKRCCLVDGEVPEYVSRHFGPDDFTYNRQRIDAIWPNASDRRRILLDAIIKSQRLPYIGSLNPDGLFDDDESRLALARFLYRHPELYTGCHVDNGSTVVGWIRRFRLEKFGPTRKIADWLIGSPFDADVELALDIIKIHGK